MEKINMIKDAVVLIPCYNPDEAIMEVFLEELSASFKHIVIINDGCSKEHDEFFKKLEHQFLIVKHYRNFGKQKCSF